MPRIIIIRVFASLCSLQFNMSFIQEFTEQQLSKNISCHMLEQIQSCHSAVEDLICNLEGVRSLPRLSVIDAKMERISAYLVIKQELVSILENDSQNAIIEWLLEHQISSPILTAILQKQTQSIREMIQRAIKKVFLKQQSLKQFIEENQIMNASLSQLKELRQNVSSNRSISRQQIRSIDVGCQRVEQKLQSFMSQVNAFNHEIIGLVHELQDFQAKISSQFRNILAKR